MSTPSAKKRPAAHDNIGPQHHDSDSGSGSGRARVARPATKRRRSLSVGNLPQLDDVDDVDNVDNVDVDSAIASSPSQSGHDLDGTNSHVRLQDFGVELQKAANAVFPAAQNSKYTKVDVILLSWEDEDPDLPVWAEAQELANTFANLYGYHVVQWRIPPDDSHNMLQLKIMQFLWDSNPNHLKIVYYAGHAKLTKHGRPAWTSRRNSQMERCPTVKWTAIQNCLEESRSDVLILLDCCSSGVCTTDEGNGVTELIAAWSCKVLVNGVGPFSFTHALNAKLRLLSQLPCFTIGQLYNAIFAEVLGWRVEALRPKKAPLHLVLNHDKGFPRSICLSKRSKGNLIPEVPLAIGSSAATYQPQGTGSLVFNSPPPEDPRTLRATGPYNQNPSDSSSTTSLNDIPEYPRLLFSIRVSEDDAPGGPTIDLFADWLSTIPIKANLVRVEAGFASDASLMMFSVSPAILGYLPDHPAMTLLGTIKSKNIMALGPDPRRAGICSDDRLPSPPSERDEMESILKMKSLITEMPPPSLFPPKKEESTHPKGGCRYIMFREDVRPMTCACQGFSQDPTAPNAVCDCGHKPCYHLATRSQTVYRQELEDLTKKVYLLEQECRLLKFRNAATPHWTFGSEEEDGVAFGFGGQNEGGQDRGIQHVQSYPTQETWNFRGD